MRRLLLFPLLLFPLLCAPAAFAEDEKSEDDSVEKSEDSPSEDADEEKEDEEPEPEKEQELANPIDPKLAQAIVQENFGSVAIIEGDVGSGTGFIINEGDKTRLYTAAHVIAGNKTLTVKNSEGHQFKKFGKFEVAAKSDLARIELLEKFESDVNLAEPGSCKVDAPLLAIGNSGGAGVLTVIKGEIESLGPDSIEVSNRVIQGNSGGPVFSGETGELLGIITHATAAQKDIWAEDTRFDKVRRFATRLDRQISWREMGIGAFLQESVRLDSFNRNTRILYAISALDPTQAGLRLDTTVGDSGTTILSIIKENKEVPVVAELLEMNIKLGENKMRTSDNDLKSRFGRFYWGASHELNKDFKKFSPISFSGYRQDDAKQALEWRKDANKLVEQAGERLR
ncbi:S1 family peptidase [Haloferula sp.]|uniref:S1 family peptidase n=1 Tax=Haloferula sp. TaxID=2497595 RepID=UPI00329DB4FC